MSYGDFRPGDFQNLKKIMKQILHNFHEHEGLYSRLDDLTQNQLKNRNQLFIFYCANKLHERLLKTKPSKEPQELQQNVLNIMKDVDNKIREFGLILHVRSVFQNEILLEFLIGRIVNKGEGRMILENELFIYMINKKLLSIRDASQFLKKVMVVTNNCDSIEPEDLRTLVRTLLERQQFRFVEHLNDFWHLESNLNLVYNGLYLDDQPKLQIEAAWVVSKRIYISLDPAKQYLKQAVIEAGPLLILLEILNTCCQRSDQSHLSVTLVVIGALFVGDSNLKQDMIDYGFVSKLIPLLGHTDWFVRKAALGAVENIAAGSDEQRQILLNNHALSYIPSTLLHQDEIIREYGVCFLGNIASGNQLQKEAVIQAGLLPLLMEFFDLHQNNCTILTQTVRVINNLAFGEDKHIHEIIDCGFVPKLIPLLWHDDVEVQYVALETAINIAGGSDEQKQVLLDHQALSYIASALLHQDEIIREYAVRLLKNITFSNQI